MDAHARAFCRLAQVDFLACCSDIFQTNKESPVIETHSPLDNLAACAISYLAGILFTLLLKSYIDSVLAEERLRQPRPQAFPEPIRALDPLES